MSRKNKYDEEEEQEFISEDEPEEEYDDEEYDEATYPVGYRIGSVILFLLAVGGLFLGLLSGIVGLFSHLVIAGDAALDKSLLGIVVSSVMGILDPAKGVNFGLVGGFAKADIFGKILGYMPLVLALCIVISLATTVVALISGKASKKCMFVNGYAVFLGYFLYAAALFIAHVFCGSVSEENYFLNLPFDVPSLVIAVATLLVLIITSIAQKKGAALLNTLLLLLTLVFFFAAFLPAGNMLANFKGALDGTAGTLGKILSFALLAFLLINVLFALFRLRMAGKYLIATIRYFIAFGLAAALIVIEAVNTSNWGLLIGAPNLALLITTFVCFLISLLCTIFKRKKSEDFEDEEDEEEERDIPRIPAHTSPDEEPAYATQSRPAYAQTASEPQANAYGTDPYAQPQADPYAHSDPYAQQAQPNSYAQQPYASAYSEPHTPPTYTEPVQKPEPQPEPKHEMTEFERMMAQMAEGNPQSEPAHQADPYATAHTAPHANPYAGATTNPYATASANPYSNPSSNPYAGAGAAAGAAASPSGGKYTYDPFINGLTEAEKNEFGDIFIANKFGVQSYLPPYVIGGDNSAFFSKVFIYLGKFRANISNGLLEKIYAYLNR